MPATCVNNCVACPDNLTPTPPPQFFPRRWRGARNSSEFYEREIEASRLRRLETSVTEEVNYVAIVLVWQVVPSLVRILKYVEDPLTLASRGVNEMIL
jgi:hypothetical protein